MSYSFQNELWDKPNAIIAFNDNNTNVMERFQKFIGEFCRAQSLNILNQKRSFEKFIMEIEDLKKSDFSFNRSTYFITEKLFEALNIQETFNEMLLKEVDEIIKEKTLIIKKDTRHWKNQKKKIFEDLSKEIQKHDLEFKRYCSRFNTKEVTYNAYLKAEENKSLSRNQVDNYHKTYLTRKSEYEQSKLDYTVVLDNFNSFQSNYYSATLPDWASQGKHIEHNRYSVLKSTFTNLSELCRALATKSNEIADRIESECDNVDCEMDCINLINKEKTGDIPPGDISFKNFESESTTDLLNTPDKHSAKVSSSSSDSQTTIPNGKAKVPVPDPKKRAESIINANSTMNTSSSSSNSSNNASNNNSKIFTKIFSGMKKPKEPSIKTTKTEIETLEALLEEKLSAYSTHELNDEIAKEIDDIKNKLESLKFESVKSAKTLFPRKNLIFRSFGSGTRNKSIDYSTVNTKEAVVLRNSTLNRGDERSEQRRSQSVSSLHRSHMEMSNDCNVGKPLSLYPSDSNGSTKKAANKSLFTPRNSKEKKREHSSSVNTKSIEVILSSGPVEIVSTPAEAMARASRINSVYSSEFDTFSECYYDKGAVETLPSKVEDSPTNRYYYIGSCVAIHEYTTCDPSDIYLSFNAGEQFYIIKEDTESSSNGWLLVERIDRSKFGYVPESYMDTRNFENPVMMHSSTPMTMQ